MELIRLGLLLILAIAQPSTAAKILAYFKMPAPSHHIAIQPILRELGNRGHHIDFYSPIPMKDPPKNFREFKLPNILLEREQQVKMSFKDFGNTVTPLLSYIMYQMIISGHYELLGNSESFTKLVQSKEKYDLIIGEFFFMNEDAATFMHKFKAPGIAIQPLGDCAWVNEMAGLPDNPSYMIDYKSLYTDQMTFFQRLHNFYTTAMTTIVSYLVTSTQLQTIADEYYNYTGWESRPRLPMLMSDLALILVNSHHSVGYSYPKAPHVKEVAGINLAPRKPLPQDLQAYMDSAKDGVIYFSYGSVVDVEEMMADGAFDAFVNAFKSLKQKVLWKWKVGTELPKIDSPNIKFSTWFPQQDILAHKNTKLFITHGGLLSMIEAVNFGVPLVGMGVFGDQPKNIVRMNTAGYGVELSYNNISQASVSWAVNEVISNPSYKKEILRRQAIFLDRPMKPLDEAVYWIEYVLKHGNVLQPASARMPFYQVYLLDVFAFLGVCCLVGLCALKCTLKCLCSLICGKKQQKASTSKKRQ